MNVIAKAISLPRSLSSAPTWAMVAILLLSWCSSALSAPKYDGHKFYVNAAGDIYLQAQGPMVVLHGAVATPIRAATDADSFYIERDSSSASGYLSPVVANSFNIAGYTLHSDVETLTEGVHAGKVLLSCLLYTSPSPRDGATSRMPSSA